MSVPEKKMCVHRRLYSLTEHPFSDLQSNKGNCGTKPLARQQVKRTRLEVTDILYTDHISFQ